MSATVQVLGLDPLTRRVKTWPQRIDSAVHEQVLVEVRPLVSTMRGLAAGAGGVAARAARRTHTVSTADGVSVVAAGEPFMFGAEFGSKRKRRRSYVTRSRAGRGYVVPRRRTTMQFRPHLGRRGYWFWPAVRTDLRGINRRVAELLRETVSP